MTTPTASSTASRARKAPQDRKPKQQAARDEQGPVRGELSGNAFAFTVDDGQSWFESRPLTDVFTPRWARQNRRREDLDAIYTAIEDAFDGDDAALDAWDALTFEQQASVGTALYEAMGAAQGE